MSEEFVHWSSAFALMCSMIALGVAVFYAVKRKEWTRGTVVLVSIAAILILLSIRAEVLSLKKRLGQNPPATCACPQPKP